MRLQKLSAILLFVSFVRAEVSVEDGRFDHVSVSFSQNIKAEDGKVLLEHLKSSLEEASDVLLQAIKLPFSKVTVKIPATWDISDWDITITETKASTKDNSKSDLVIDGANDVAFGKFPHAHQYGGCGIPGHQIVIPTEFFSENNPFPKGTALAREWLKYRYGVFDENGYPNDPLYPLYYVTPGDDLNKVVVTDCTHIPVMYDFVNKSSDGDCSQSETTVFANLKADLCDIRLHNESIESIENVTSSIMYYQKDINTMQHICNEENHNARSPNKHNTLCSRQSILEVVKKSLDLDSIDVGDAGAPEIEFTYVQQAKPKLVIAWEDTASMRTKKEVILNAAQQIVIDLPEGSHFASFHFKDQLAQNKDDTLHELTGSEKIRVLGNIASDFLQDKDADINLAINHAITILSSAAVDETPDGTIIVITRSSRTLDNDVLDALKNPDMCLTLMFLSDDDIPEDLSTAFAGLPCSTVEKIAMGGTDVETFEDLYNGMRFFLPSIIGDKETRTVKIGYLDKESPSLSIEVDDSVESATFWVYKKKDSDSFDLKFKGEKKDNEIKTTIIGEVREMVYSVPQAGTIEFGYPHGDERILTQIKVTSKAGNYFTGEVLIHDTTEDSTQMPVIIYAFIRYGAYPVQNAHVSATIQKPDGSNTTLDLYDNGRGDPDITQNDGIYSRYFIEFSGEGDYTVTVTVKNHQSLSSYGVTKDADYMPCCGSSINGKTPKLGYEFSKEFATTFTAKSGPPEDGYKPSRILDLRVDEVTDDKLTLEWTAPGAQADHGAAQSYEIKYFTTPDETKIFENGTALEYTAKPQEVGKIENFEIEFSSFGKSGLHYIAMKTTNVNKTSDLSNIIEISIPEGAITETPDEGKDDKKDNLKKARTSNELIGIIVAIILAVIVLIILIYLAIYFVVVKPKRRENKEGERNEAPKGRDSTAMNSITFIPASTIMEHHNEKTKAKLENKEQPVFKEEDFADRKYQPTNELGEGDNISNTQSDKVNTNGQPNLPPKSPKRTTPV